MNLKMNWPRPSLAVLLACLAITATTVSAGSSSFCMPDLVEGYTMDGTESPKKINLEMCPLVKNSCCLRTDQAMFYKNWFFSGDRTYLIEKINDDMGIYSDLLEELVRVQDLARKVQSNLSDRLISNCKVLARRITHFNIREVTPKLKEITKNFHKFIETTYSGFYCAICDADNHRFIKPNDKQLIFSNMFCRDIITNSLHFLLYFHVHLINYLNLQIKFLSFCDGNGRFFEQPIDELLYMNPPYKRLLLSCRDARNEKNWRSECLSICTKFNIVEFRDFFRPNVLQFKESILTLTELRKKMKASLKRRTLIDSVKMTGRRRVLAEQEANKEQQTDEEKEKAAQAEEERKRLEKEKRLRDATVFQAEEANIPFEKFRSLFEEEGLHYADYGREIQFDEDLAKELDEIRTKGKLGSREDTEDDDETEVAASPRMAVERSTKSDGNLMSRITALLLLLTSGLLI